MALRIGHFVTAGELFNTRRNSIFGWIEFAPDYGVRIEVAGNFKGPLAGKHFRFRIDKPENEFVAIADLPETVANLANQQIGVIGNALIQESSIPTGPVNELPPRSPAGTSPSDIRESLYLEWFSQNGRVIAEIVSPCIEFISEHSSETPVCDREPIDDPNAENPFLEDTDVSDQSAGPSITGNGIADDDSAIDQEPPPDSGPITDPYELFDHNLEQKINQSLGDRPDAVVTDSQADDLAGWDDNGFQAIAGEKKSWDDVIPGIDPETQALYESWDEVFDGESDEPVSTLFDPPLELPAPDSITSDKQAEPVLQKLLARLALLNVAIDLCEHCTPLSAYRMLLDEILPDAHIHPNLAATEIVQHYCAYEYCRECEAAFEEEYEHRNTQDD